MIYTTRAQVDQLSHAILKYAILVHKELGPGLLESIYEKCMAHILKENGYTIDKQNRVPLHFHGITLDCELRYDLLVNDCVIVEIKAMDGLLPVHEAQLLTYLKLLNKPKGILINFNCTNIIHEGQRTFVTEQYRQLPKE